MWPPRRDLLRLFLIGAAPFNRCPPSGAEPVSPVQDAPSAQPARDKTPDYAAPAAAETVRPDRHPTGCPSPPDRRARIPYIEKNGTAWIKERNCLACHYAGYMLWSLRDASQRGFAIDQGKLAESTNWAISQTDAHGFGLRRCGADVDRPRSIGPERKNQSSESSDARRDHQGPGKRRILGYQAASFPPRSGRSAKRSR